MTTCLTYRISMYDTKRAATNMKRENFYSTSVGKSLSRYNKASINNTFLSTIQESFK